jgi:hypothetical protein
LSDFSVAERFSWAASRETFRQEDKAYSLFGIFGIYMTLIYSEGKEHAFKRLQAKIDKNSKSKHMISFNIPPSVGTSTKLSSVI